MRVMILYLTMRQMSVPILEGEGGGALSTMRVMILLPDNEADVSANFGGGGGALSTMRVMILYLTMRQMSVPILGGGGRRCL